MGFPASGDDISAYLVLEVKRELAERYFGFRKSIEDNKAALAEKVRNHANTVEQKICLELTRIILLLGEHELVCEFFQLTGLAMDCFYDPFLLESGHIRKRAFSLVRLHGLTREGRFTNLLFDSYNQLERLVEQYREQYSQLLVEEETIRAEISLFERRHDLGIILDFLRNIDAGYCVSPLGDEICQGVKDDLARKMQLVPPEPLTGRLPFLPSLVQGTKLKKELKGLARRAWRGHGAQFVY